MQDESRATQGHSIVTLSAVKGLSAFSEILSSAQNDMAKHFGISDN